MAKGKGRKRKGGGGRPVAQDPAAIVRELEALAEKLATLDPGESGPVWGAAHKLLLKTDTDHAAAGRVIMHRDIGEFQSVLAGLRGEAPAAPAEPEPAPAAPAHDIPATELKKALRAFKKRLKLTRLDHESRLSVSPLTSGKTADIDAILPPHEFPKAVWEALCAEGRLVNVGAGFYELAEEA
jgi:hypothetical protein